MTNPRIGPVVRATGRPWEDWLRFMDGIGAQQLDHKQIALKVFDELDGTVDRLGWWTQAVTVAYEQHIGRRVPGQRPDGTFQMSVSRATTLGMAELMDTWRQFASDDETMQSLVGGPVRCSGTERRITWRTRARDGSSIIVTSEPKRDGTASIVATQTGLATLEQNDEARRLWADTLTRLLRRAWAGKARHPAPPGPGSALPRRPAAAPVGNGDGL